MDAPAGRPAGSSDPEQHGGGHGLFGAAGSLGNRLLAGLDRLGRPAARHRIARAARSLGLVVAALVVILAGLGAAVAALSGIVVGVRAAADQLTSAQLPAPPHRLAVTESMTILTGKMDGHPGWPRYTNTSWTVHSGQEVVLRITSYDDGTAPLTGVQTMYDHVQGTAGGTELVDGKAVSAVSNQDVAHTFTVVALGLNLPIPSAPTGGSVTVVARFTPALTGTFVWQCYAPCGSGMNSMGGAMSTMGWMEGKVRVTA